MSADPKTQDSDRNFIEAKYYDCTDPEQLHHESPEEAIEYYLDGIYEHGVGPLLSIEKHSPIKVTAYKPRVIPEAERASWASGVFESLDEWMSEEYADPDGDGLLCDHRADLERLLLAVVNSAADRAKVWSCEAVAEREYSAAEVEALMREHRPDWFEEKEAASNGTR